MRSLIFMLIMLSLTSSAFAANQVTIIPEVNVRSQQTFTTKQDTREQTTHIKREQIKTSPVVNLSELLQQEQSIVRLTNNSNDSSQTALSIRGFGDNAAANSLILVDGFPLTNVSLLAPNFNSIALSDIERIDIIQGSQGSLWGDQAVGGVVNIVTRHPEQWIADAYAGFGNVNQRFYNALVGNKFSNGLFFKVFGFTNQADNYRDHNRQRNASAFAQVGVDYARGILRFNIQSSENTVLLPGSLSQAQYDANPHQANNFKNFSHYKTQTLQLLNKHELNANWLLETRLAHQVLNDDGFISSTYKRNESEDLFNPRLIGTLWNSKLILGYMGQRSHYHFMNEFFHERVTATQNDLYAQTIVPLNNQFDFTVGVRSAWQNNNTEKIIGQSVQSLNRVLVTEQGFAYHPSAEWQFFLRRDGNFRFPKANEQTWIAPGTRGLLPQTGASYEAGFVRTVPRQKTQLNVYQLSLHNEIAFDPTETLLEPMGMFSNFSATRRRGVTLTETYDITSNLKFDSQLNYVDPRFASGLFTGKQIPSVPRFNANAGLRYAFAENWRTKFTALYTGNRYASFDLANVGKMQPGYWLNTLALQYIRKSYEINFEVGNMFNTKFPAFTIYNAASHSYSYYPGSGRSYLLTLKTSIGE